MNTDLDDINTIYITHYNINAYCSTILLVKSKIIDTDLCNAKYNSVCK